MFSTTQLSYIESKINKMFLQGYKHYIIHTNTNFGISTNREHRDIVLYFSKEEIALRSDYTFRTGSKDTIKIEVISGNPSSQYQYDREVITNANNIEVVIPKYEFVISSVESLYHIDTIALNKYEYQNSKMFNFEFYLIPFSILLLFLYTWVRNVFPRILSRGEKL